MFDREGTKNELAELAKKGVCQGSELPRAVPTIDCG